MDSWLTRLSRMQRRAGEQPTSGDTRGAAVGVGWGRGSPGSPGVSSQGEVSLELPPVAALCDLKLWGTKAALTEI